MYWLMKENSISPSMPCDFSISSRRCNYKNIIVIFIPNGVTLSLIFFPRQLPYFYDMNQERFKKITILFRKIVWWSNFFTGFIYSTSVHPRVVSQGTKLFIRKQYQQNALVKTFQQRSFFALGWLYVNQTHFRAPFFQGYLGNTNPIQISALTCLFGTSNVFQKGTLLPSITNNHREDAFLVHSHIGGQTEAVQPQREVPRKITNSCRICFQGVYLMPKCSIPPKIWTREELQEKGRDPYLVQTGHWYWYISYRTEHQPSNP